MKKVWIVAPFSSINTLGSANRFQYLSNILSMADIDVTLFTSDFSHGAKKHISNDIVAFYPFKVKLINEPGYGKNVSLKRILSHIKFSMNLKKEIYQLEVPDLIYVAYPTMSASFVAGKFAKKNAIPFFIDIQDTWPESISAALNTDSLVAKLMMFPFKKIANHIFRMADVVFGVSRTYVERTKVKGTNCKEFIPVYIGSDLKKFTNSTDCEEQIFKEAEDIWVTYVGSMSHSYDIATAVKAFSLIKKYPNIKLNILGLGPDEEELKTLANCLDVNNKNVFFWGLLEYERMIAVLKKSDIGLNALTAGSKGTITNKFGDYISAFLPILNSCQEKEILDLMEKKELGISYEPGNHKALAEAILKIVKDKDRLVKYSENAKQFAKDCFDREKTYKIITEKIKDYIYD